MVPQFPFWVALGSWDFGRRITSPKDSRFWLCENLWKVVECGVSWVGSDVVVILWMGDYGFGAEDEACDGDGIVES